MEGWQRRLVTCVAVVACACGSPLRAAIPTPPLAISHGPAPSPVRPAVRRAVGTALDLATIGPAFGGVCQTCPVAAPDFGPFSFGPPGTCTTHSSATSGAGDCNWYAFDVVVGHRYSWSTCNACTTWDTILELWDPSLCPAPAGLLAESDDGAYCGQQSRIEWLAPWTGVVHVRLSGNGAAFGSYCLDYCESSCSHRGVGAGDPGAAICQPVSGVLDPTSTCQYVHGCNSIECTEVWYDVILASGSSYVFTTCGFGSCLAADVTPMAPTGPCPAPDYDTQLFLYAPGTCPPTASLLSNDDDVVGGCGKHAAIGRGTAASPLFTPPVAGIWKLRVTISGAAAACNRVGCFDLGYRDLGAGPCTPLSNVTVSPSTAIARPTSCSPSVDFVVTSDGDPTAVYTWIITPPAGGTAAPSTGGPLFGESAPGNTAIFSSILQGAGDFTISVAAASSCAPGASATTTFTLRDQTPPALAIPADTMVECDLVPLPATPSAPDNCDPAPVIALSETTAAGPCGGSYDILRTWTATDASGNVAGPLTQTIRVRDTRGPDIVANDSYLDCIYPPNHAMACFTVADFAPVIVEPCSPPVTWRFVDVLDSEAALGACMPGDLSPDWTISPDGVTACVRAERCGTDPSVDDGRLYTLVAEATDGCGNVGPRAHVGVVLVPHDTADTSGCITP